MAHSLWVLDNDPDHPAGGAVGDLDPVAAEARLGRQVDRDGRHRLTGRVSVQLSHLEMAKWFMQLLKHNPYNIHTNTL